MSELFQVHFMIPLALATRVANVAGQRRTTRRVLWIAAMCDYLGKAWEPGQAVSDAPKGTEPRTTTEEGQ